RSPRARGARRAGVRARTDRHRRPLRVPAFRRGARGESGMSAGHGGAPAPAAPPRPLDPLAPSVLAPALALAPAALAAGRGLRLAPLLWIVVAMVGARSAAMGFNRLADHELDARNPRTAGRELPTGRLRRAEVWAFVVGSAAVFALAAGMLNPLCLA